MRKLSFAMLLVLAAGCWSCGSSNGNNENSDSTIVSISPEDNVDCEKTAIGVAIDGAMNSITLLDLNGDTLYFSYPDLDPSKRAAWSIGDTISIKYVEVNEEIQVNAVIKGNRP